MSHITSTKLVSGFVSYDNKGLAPARLLGDNVPPTITNAVILNHKYTIYYDSDINNVYNDMIVGRYRKNRLGILNKIYSYYFYKIGNLSTWAMFQLSKTDLSTLHISLIWDMISLYNCEHKDQFIFSKYLGLLSSEDKPAGIESIRSLRDYLLYDLKSIDNNGIPIVNLIDTVLTNGEYDPILELVTFLKIVLGK